MGQIVSDGWSMGILFRELAALYKAFSSGKPSPLPELPIQYADFAVWQRERLQREVLEKRRKQLLKLGKPFETALERNITEMNLIESELEKKNAELKLLEGEDGKKAQEVRSRLKDEIEQLQTKRQTMTTHEQKTLMIVQ